MSAAAPTTHETPIPAAVQKQYDDARKLLLDAQAEESGQPPADPVNTATPAAPVVAPAVPSPVVPASAGITATPPVVAPQPVQPVNGDSAEAWAQRYHVLQGKYQNEVPRLNSQLRQALADNANLRQQMAALQTVSQAVAAPVATPAPVTPARPLTKADITDDEVKQEVSAEDIETYGPDHWKTVIARDRNRERKLREEFSQSFRQQPAAAGGSLPEVQELRSVLAEANQTKFEDGLTVLHPDWREINETEPWKVFLAEVNPISGMTYQEHINEAQAAFSAVRVAAVLSEFKNRANGGAPAIPPTPPAPQPVKRTVTLPSVQAQVAPGTRAAEPATPKPIYTMAQFQQRVKEISALGGQNEAEAKRQFEELKIAATEGRVIGMV